MFVELTQLAIRNLLRARARLAMTAGGVLVGTAAIILLIALTNGLQRAAELGMGASAELTRMNVAQKWSWNPDGSPGPEFPKLTQDAVDAFWQIEGVQAVVGMKSLYGGQLKTPDGLYGWASVYGVDPAMLPYFNLNVAQGELALEPGRNQIIFGFDVGNYFNDPEATEWQPIQYDVFNEPLVMELISPNEAREINLNVRGVLAEGQESYRSFMALQDVIALNSFLQPENPDQSGDEPAPFTYDELIVITTGREVSADVMRAIQAMEYEVYGPVQILEQINGFFGTMRLALGGVGAIALLVSAFGVANTMTMAILERTREIGLMKAVGATNQDVLTVFLVEAGLVGFVGGIAGAGVSVLVQNGVNGFLRALSSGGEQNGPGPGMMFMPFDLSQINGELLVVDTTLVLLAVGIATAVGLAAGFYPSWRAAAKLEPVTALKTD